MGRESSSMHSNDLRDLTVIVRHKALENIFLTVGPDIDVQIYKNIIQ